MSARKKKTLQTNPNDKKAPPAAKDAFNPRVLREPDKIIDEATGKTILIDALLKNDMALFEKILKAGASPDKATKEGKTPLHYAARLGNVDAILRLTDAGAQTNPRDKTLETPLFDALHSDNATAAFDALLSRGANIDIQDMHGRTVLHDAARILKDSAKDHELLKKLIHASKNPDVPDERGVTPFLLACQVGAKTSVETFLFERVSIFSADRDGNTCLHHAAARMDGGDVCRFLLSGEAAGIANAVNLQGKSALHTAVKQGDEETVRAMHDAGANMNLPDNIGITPLQEAALARNVKMAGSLIRLGADISKTHAITGTPLLLTAVRTNNPAMVALFMDHSADPNLQDAQGVTALMEASFRNDNVMVGLLLERGADASKKDRLERNALHHAGAQLTEKTICLLIKAGADIEATDTWKRTPLQSAVREHNLVTALVLLDAGANPNVTDDQGQSPLHIAVAQRRIPLIEELLRKKADPNVADKSLKMTPLHTACNMGLEREANLLIKAGAKVTVKDHMGRTPLHNAVQGYNFGLDELTKTLVRNGADPTEEDKFGATPYDIAHSLNKHSLIDFFKKELLKKGKKYTPKRPQAPPWGGGPFVH